jgi:gamma-glutamylcyclotransferase (GGCT)/AIG2-like uncharacterized protein YtfP
MATDKLVFVYGTLKTGGRLNYKLVETGATLVGPARILSKDHVMRSLGGFPALQKVATGSGTYIQGELWVVSTDGIRVLDMVEGYPHFYSRTDVTVWTDGEGGQSFKALAYHIQFNHDNPRTHFIMQAPVIDSGEWDAIRNKPVGEADDDSDCPECGYYKQPTDDCANCGSTEGVDTEVPWSDDDDESVFHDTDFTVDQGIYITSEWGESYGPYESVADACRHVAVVANEIGADCRTLTVGLRVINRNMNQEQVDDLYRDTTYV